jgi:hypothetical protein
MEPLSSEDFAEMKMNIDAHYRRLEHERDPRRFHTFTTPVGPLKYAYGNPMALKKQDPPLSYIYCNNAPHCDGYKQQQQQQFFQCNGCRMVHYCSLKCQKGNDWETHRYVCSPDPLIRMRGILDYSLLLQGKNRSFCNQLGIQFDGPSNLSQANSLYHVFTRFAFRLNPHGSDYITLTCSACYSRECVTNDYSNKSQAMVVAFDEDLDPSNVS